MSSIKNSSKNKSDHMGVPRTYNVRTRLNRACVASRRGKKNGSRLRRPVTFEECIKAYPWSRDLNDRVQVPRFHVCCDQICPIQHVSLRNPQGNIELAVIQIGTTKFPVHKKIFDMASPFFKSKFRYHKSNSGVIRILEGVPLNDWGTRPDPYIFRTILNYAYTGKLLLKHWTVIDIYNMADYLMMPHVMRNCVIFMAERIDISTVCSFANFGEHNKFPLLINLCSQFFMKYLDEISLRHDYMWYFPTFIARVFRADNFCLRSPKGHTLMRSRDREVAILDYVLRYLSHHDFDHKVCADVFSAVRLLDIKPSIVARKMRRHMDLLRNKEIRRLIHLGKTLFKFPHKALVADYRNCIPSSWRRHRVYGHSRVHSSIPREMFRLGKYEISKIVISTRTINGSQLIVKIELQFRTNDTKRHAFSIVYGDTSDLEHTYEADLEEKEHINRCKYTTVGGYLNTLEFTSDLGFIYGPLGEFHQDESPKIEGVRRDKPGRYVYLQNLGCVVETVEGTVRGIRSVNLIWVVFI